jgi:hypothetical protein
VRTPCRGLAHTISMKEPKLRQYLSASKIYSRYITNCGLQKRAKIDYRIKMAPQINVRYHTSSFVPNARTCTGITHYVILESSVRVRVHISYSLDLLGQNI